MNSKWIPHVIISNLSEKLNELIESGFTKKEVKEIETSLVNLTNEIINPRFGHFKKRFNKTEVE